MTTHTFTKEERDLVWCKEVFAYNTTDYFNVPENCSSNVDKAFFKACVDGQLSKHDPVPKYLAFANGEVYIAYVSPTLIPDERVGSCGVKAILSILYPDSTLREYDVSYDLHWDEIVALHSEYNEYHFAK